MAARVEHVAAIVFGSDFHLCTRLLEERKVVGHEHLVPWSLVLLNVEVRHRLQNSGFFLAQIGICVPSEQERCSDARGDKSCR